MNSTSKSCAILSTKLRAPPARAKRVSRPRLLDRLDEGLTHPLALISAPAGFGKTSLLVEWAGRRGQAVARRRAESAE